jgi:hypothetical protein
MMIAIMACAVFWGAPVWADIDGTTPIKEISVVSENGDKLYVASPGGSFEKIEFKGKYRTFIVTDRMLDLKKYKIFLSGMQMWFYGGAYEGGNIVNYITIPIGFLDKKDESGRNIVGSIIFTFKPNDGVTVEIYSDEYKTNLVDRFHFK